MAIYRLTGDGGYSIDDIVSWLNANKEGTFLENAVIAKETVHPMQGSGYTVYGDTFSIIKGDTSFRMAFATSLDTDSEIPYANLSTSDYSQSFGNALYESIGYRDTIRKGNLILCSNGLLIATKFCTNEGVLIKTVCRIALTTDAVGDLLMLSSDTSAGSNGIQYENKLTVSNTPSFAGYNMELKPAANFRGTSMSNVVLFGTDTSEKLEDVFIASVSQQNVNAEQPEAVTLNGKDYITNGRIYIKDE